MGAGLADGQGAGPPLGPTGCVLDRRMVALMERKNTIRTILSKIPEESVKDAEVASLFFASQERLEFQ